MKSNVCVISWLHFGSMLNCEKSDEWMKSYLQPPRGVLCVCFVSGAENDNLPTVPLFGVGSALESYCKCLACIIVPSHLTSELTPSCWSEDSVNRFRSYCLWIRGVTVALFTFLIKIHMKNKTEMAFLTQIVYIEQCWFFIKSKQDVLYKIWILQCI